MSDDAPDLEALAKRFLDLWQDQVAASVADPAMAEWLARFLAAPGAPGGPGAETTMGVSPYDPGAFADIFTSMAAGAAPAAASSGAGDDRVDELLDRLAGIESRLAALESGAGKPGGKPRGRSRKRTG
ncbi:MAG: hypothetical protein IIA00_10345 [Proteobacteria bacterium]|nr:hypothetical protein [Pseudomonadota bacterium]